MKVAQNDRHEEEKIFHCTYGNCAKVFYKKWNYNLHMKMHLKIKQFECKHCGKSFTQKCNYNKHLRTHVMPTLRDRKTFQCHICLKKYTQAYNLRVSTNSFIFTTSEIHMILIYLCHFKQPLKCVSLCHCQFK